MRALPVILLVVVVVVAVFANGVDAGSLRRTDPACKTVETVPDLDLSAYTTHAWYVQQQQVVRYQPLDAFYCVRAEYTLNDAGDEVEVFNTARNGGVDGDPTNAQGMKLRALVEDKDVSNSKLLVGPTFLPRFTYGPYWIVATSPDTPDPELGYDWAIVSGGAPTRLTDQENGECFLCCLTVCPCELCFFQDCAPPGPELTTRGCGCSRASRSRARRWSSSCARPRVSSGSTLRCCSR